MNEEAKEDLAAMLQALNLPPAEQEELLLLLPKETRKRWRAYTEELKSIVRALKDAMTKAKLPACIYFEVPEGTSSDYLIYFAAGVLGYDKSETEPRCLKHKDLDIKLKLVEPGQGLKVMLASTTAHGNA